jgi:hypothetical protein
MAAVRGVGMRRLWIGATPKKSEMRRNLDYMARIAASGRRWWLIAKLLKSIKIDANGKQTAVALFSKHSCHLRLFISLFIR